MLKHKNSCDECGKNLCLVYACILYYKLKVEDCPCFDCLLKVNCSKICNNKQNFKDNIFETYWGGKEL